MAIAAASHQARPAWPSTALRGPADADHYRVKVGRYGDRWYQDGDAGPFPSISTVKKASGQDWSAVSLKRVAWDDDLARIATIPPEMRYERMKSINQYGLSVAAGRGSIIHWWFEDMLTVGAMRTVTEQMLVAARIPTAALQVALPYQPAVAQFFDHYQPEVIAAEMVVIHTTLNGHGYGGTGDVVLRIEGDTWYGDWKSRGADSDHGAYPEEGAQVAAAARAEYMIVADGPGEVERIAPPAAAGGLIVSVKPDGCRLYPVDLDRGFEHFTALHAWWVARRSERDAIGRPWAPRSSAPVAAAAPAGDGGSEGVADSTAATPSSIAPDPTPAPGSGAHSADPGPGGPVEQPAGAEAPQDAAAAPSSVPAPLGGRLRASASPVAQMVAADDAERQALRARHQAMRESAIKTGWVHQFDAQLTALGVGPNSTNAEVAAALATIEPPFDVVAEPAPPREVAPAPAVERPERADAKAVQSLVEAIRSSGVRDVVNAWVAQGSWSPLAPGADTVANFERTRAALALAVATDGDEDTTRLILATAMIAGDAELHVHSIGEIIGSLTVPECARVIALAEAFGPVLGLRYDDAGRPHLDGDVSAVLGVAA